MCRMRASCSLLLLVCVSAIPNLCSCLHPVGTSGPFGRCAPSAWSPSPTPPTGPCTGCAGKRIRTRTQRIRTGAQCDWASPGGCAQYRGPQLGSPCSRTLCGCGIRCRTRGCDGDTSPSAGKSFPMVVCTHVNLFAAWCGPCPRVALCCFSHPTPPPSVHPHNCHCSHVCLGDRCG